MNTDAARMWIYIAGPYSQPNPVVNAREACLMYDRIRNSAPPALVICPHWSMTQEMVKPKPHEYWMEHDLRLIRTLYASELPGCIFRIGGDSEGADMETELAGDLGIPVYRNFATMMLWAASIMQETK